MQNAFTLVKTGRKLNTTERYECQAMTELNVGGLLTANVEGGG
jgi:hypothetical protein